MRIDRDAMHTASFRLLSQLRRRGHTLRGIAAELNGQGHRTRRGTAWRLESVVRVLKRDAVAGVAR